MASERELIAAIARLAADAEEAAGGGQGDEGQANSSLPHLATRKGPNKGSRLLLGIGDDCAILQPDPARVLLLTTDTLIQGVHFEPAWHPPRLLGRKAVAVNVSDIAAMGGSPRYLLLSLGLTGNEDDNWRRQLLDGLVTAAKEYGATLIGGDTVRSPQGVTLTVTVLGEAPPGQVCRRDGGRAGDDIWVSGPLGRAAAGLELCRRGLDAEPVWQPLIQAHLDPTAQVELGRALAAAGLVHAMMDLSDGLATDLAHLCAAGNLGAEIAADQLPIEDLLRQAAAQCQADPLEWAIAGGEDYQLLFTAPPAQAAAIAELGHRLNRAAGRQSSGGELRRIGRLLPQPGVFLVTGQQRREIGFGGYDHFPT